MNYILNILLYNKPLEEPVIEFKMSTNPITRDTDCLALLQSREYTKSELLGMMKEPKRDSKGREHKCIHCGDRDCYGRCDAHFCDCKEPCKASSCGAHWLFEKMSELKGTHPHYYSLIFYCIECDRLGCRCCTKCKLYYQCNCYGQLDNDDDEEYDYHDATYNDTYDDACDDAQDDACDDAQDEDVSTSSATENAGCYTDDEEPIIDIASVYTCIRCDVSIRTEPDMKFMRLCSKFYCEDCFHVTSETISEEEVDTYYNTTTYENGCDGWYNPETNTFHIGNWVNNKFIPDMDDNRNIEYYNNM